MSRRYRLNPIELFPLRLDQQDPLPDIEESWHSQTVFDGKKVVRIEASGEDNAEGRTQRLHEALHANRGPGTYPDVISDDVQDIMEDIFVHLRIGGAIRAKFHPVFEEAVQTELENLRNLEKRLKDLKAEPAPTGGVVKKTRGKVGSRPPTGMVNPFDRHWNKVVGECARALATAHGTMYGHGTPMYEEDRKASFDPIWALLQKLLGEQVRQALWNGVVVEATSRPKEAAKALQDLLNPPIKRVQHKLDSVQHIEELPLQFRPLPSELLELLGSSSDDPVEFRIKHAQMDVVSNHKVMVRRKRLGKSGFSIASRRVVAAALGQKTVFQRRVREKHPGGVILLDASGSMSVTTKEIERLLEEAPMATVAYYCGAHEDGEGKFGELTIAAQGGRRATKLPKKCGGGNDIDYEALCWALQQRGPRIFITDRGFCGGQASKALRLLQKMEGSAIEVYPNISKALQAQKDGFYLVTE